MTKIISILNHKGGVGKTTTAINLAAAMQLKGKKVMAIDLDGQANLTESLGFSIEEERTIYGAMGGEYPLPLYEREGGITVVPSCLDLSAAESELINEPGREMILKGLIANTPDIDNYDYIFIDCPPSLGLLSLNALTASDYVIIPVQAQYLSMRGMAKILDVVKVVRERLNPKLEISGLLITQYNKRISLSRTVEESIKEAFYHKVFDTLIRTNVRLAEAPAAGQSIFEYDNKCNGAQDYMSLACEILEKEEGHE